VGEEVEVTTFLVKAGQRRTGLWTSAAYLSWIVYGLREHGISEDYIAHVQEIAKQTNTQSSTNATVGAIGASHSALARFFLRFNDDLTARIMLVTDCGQLCDRLLIRQSSDIATLESHPHAPIQFRLQVYKPLGICSSLAHVDGYAGLYPEDQAGRERRRAEVRCELAARYAGYGDKYRDALVKFYGDERGRKVRYAQAFEVCEYGRQPSQDELRQMFPF
jgi:hypothetical protein